MLNRNHAEHCLPPPPGMSSPSPSSPPASAICALTRREREVLNLRAKGLVYKQIADRLGISTHTVKNHLESIHHKLRVHNTIEALNAAGHEGTSFN